MTPQTKLKVAAEEIKEILRKHDIASSFVLHTPGHSEFVNHFNTSYSCAYQYQENEMRFYCKREDYKSEEEQIKKLSDTANMLQLLTETVGVNFMIIEPLSKRFNQLTNAVHK
tara:strand:+ start:18024 stop:18362 length:339 start_codon:yes stop_codon:yes gene_type:complete